MNDAIQRQLQRLPVLHDYHFSSSTSERFHDPDVCRGVVEEASRCKNRGMLMEAAHGYYVDWLLTRRRASREACIECVYQLGLWSTDLREAAYLLVFAVLSGNPCHEKCHEAAERLDGSEDSCVLFFQHILKEGAEGLGVKIRNVCIEEFDCCPALVWFANRQQSPFVEWLLPKHGISWKNFVPSMKRSEILLEMDALKALRVAEFELRPYDLEVYHVLVKLADDHRVSGNFAMEIRRLRQALSVTYRRHVAFGEALDIQLLNKLMRAETSLMLAGHATETPLALAKCLLTQDGSAIDPDPSLAMAVALAHDGKLASAMYHVDTFHRLRKNASDHSIHDWHEGAFAFLRREGLTISALL